MLKASSASHRWAAALLLLLLRPDTPAQQGEGGSQSQCGPQHGGMHLLFVRQPIHTNELPCWVNYLVCITTTTTTGKQRVGWMP